MIYKICPERDWIEARHKGVFEGSGIDFNDGFIHFSKADQVSTTLQRHFQGQQGLLLIAVNPDTLAGDLRYEASHDGELFPHLYTPLPVSAAHWVKPITVDTAGKPLLPEL